MSSFELKNFSIYTIIGVVLAVSASIFASQSKIWDDKEPFSYNAKLRLSSLLFPKPHGIMDKPINDQMEYWAKSTQLMEQGSTKLSLWMIGGPLFAPSFGPNATRTTTFTVPSVETPGYHIPVTCAVPYNSVPENKIPLVFYFFQGGFIIGSVEAELPLSRWLAQEANAVVCSVGYRKVPQNPFPTPVNDVIDAIIGILEHKVPIESLLQIAIDFDRVATWGMSAGGYMAAQAARRLTERGYRLKCQMSLIPMAKPHGGTRSMLKNWDDLWSGPHNIYAWTMFLPDDDGSLANDWRVSLIRDPPDDVVANLPPTYIEIHTRDVLRDEGEM